MQLASAHLPKKKKEEEEETEFVNGATNNSNIE